METKEVLQSLAALSQETRLAIFRLLVEEGRDGLAAGQISERLDLAAATASFHLKELAAAGLIRARQERRFIYYSADFDAMNGLISYLTDNCCKGKGACVTDCTPACLPQRGPARIAALPHPRQPKRKTIARRPS